MDKEANEMTSSEKTTKNDKKNAQIRRLNEQINEAEKRLGLLNQLENEFEAISATVTRCIDLVAKSAQGEKADALYEDMHNMNRAITRGARNSFEADENSVKTRIEKITEEKLKLSEEDDDEEEN